MCIGDIEARPVLDAWLTRLWALEEIDSIASLTTVPAAPPGGGVKARQGEDPIA